MSASGLAANALRVANAAAEAAASVPNSRRLSFMIPSFTRLLPPPCGEAEIASEPREQFRVGGNTRDNTPHSKCLAATPLGISTSPPRGGNFKSNLQPSHHLRAEQRGLAFLD